MITDGAVVAFLIVVAVSVTVAIGVAMVGTAVAVIRRRSS